jgi:hypothetical protein
MRRHAEKEGAISAAEIDLQRTRGIGEEVARSELTEVI